MKKIFYILASAIVALGAIACENEGLENINPENNGNGEGLTITATIDEATKVVFNNDFAATGWESGDYVTINGYQFNYVPAEGLFRCEDEAAKALIGTTQTATANALKSANGIKGSSFVATKAVEIQPGVNISFKLSSALLKYTTTEEVAFTGNALSGAFTDATKAGSVKYIAVKTGEEGTLSYSVDGVQCKSITKNFEPGKIYNLGTLTAPVVLVPNSNWTTANAWFVAYFCNGTSSPAAVKMTKQSDGSYIALLPEGDFKDVVFCRMNPEKTEHNWEDGSVWGQTQDMTISKGDRCGIIGWNTGMWKSEHKTTELYLLPNDDWKQANARFAAYFYGNGEKWISMTKHVGDVYKVTIPTGYPSIIFCRMNPGNAANNWSNKWNQTAGNNAVKVSGNGGKVYEITGWDNSGKWVEIKF